MPLGKRDRLTKERREREIRKWKRVIPAWFKKGDAITKLEMAVANYESSLITTASYCKVYPDDVRLLVWLSQFEFFEKNFVWTTYRVPRSTSEVHTDRHASIALKRLEKGGLIELYKKRRFKYKEETDDLEIVEKWSNNTYQISMDGMEVVSTFYYNLVNDRPVRVNKKNRQIIWKTQTKNDLDNLSDRFDSIIS